MSELLDQYRQKYPVYMEIDDATLADGIYRRHYADKMGRDEFDAQLGLEPPAPPIQEKSMLDRIGRGADDVVRSLADGMTFGFADEIAAGADTMFNDKSYDENYRAQASRTDEIDPMIAIPSQIAGGIMTGGGAARAGMEAMKSAPLAARVLGYAGIGAAEGAVAGAGYSDPGSRGEGAAMGGALGGILGVGAPAVMGGVRKASQAVSNLRGKPVNVAQRKMVEALQRDGYTPDEAIARVQKMGDSGAMVDVGKNSGALGEVVATKPGAALTTADEMLNKRAGGQADRILKAFETVIPKQTSVVPSDMSQRFMQSLKTRVPLTPELRTFASRPSIQTAWKNAQKIAREQGQDLPPLSEITTRSDIKEVETTVLHWVKKGLDDALEPKRDAITGALSSPYGKNLLADMQKTRAQFRDIVKDLNPEYGKMLGELSGPLKLDEAVQAGSRFFQYRNPRDLKQVFDRMNPDQKGAFQRSVLQAIEDKISPRASMGEDASRQIIMQEDKLRVIFGEKADEILSTLRQEREFANTGRNVLGNSRTAFRQEAMADLAQDPVGVGIDAVTRPKDTIINAIATALRRPRDEVSDELAKMLFETNKDKMSRIAADLSSESSRAGTITNRNTSLAAALMGGSANTK
jgi:hypothetical protein